MHFFTLIWIISIMLSFLEADGLKCWRYDASQLIAWSADTIPGEKHLLQDEVKPIEWVYMTAVGEVAERKDIALAAKVSGRIYRHNYIDCHKKEYGFACGGECDSGQLQLDKQMRLRLKWLDFTKEVKYEGMITELELESRDKKIWLKATEVSCPKSILEGSYVCYNKRKGKEYRGCIRSTQACKNTDKKHFGRYSDESSTRDALWRCQSSKPKFVD